MSAPAEACDICGCGVGSYYTGILPEFNKKIFGLRYRLNGLRTHVGPGGTSSYLTTDETYRTLEIWGGWTIGKKFRVMGYVPVSFNEKLNQGMSYHKAGIGDAGVQGYYRLFDKQHTRGRSMIMQSLWVGAGVKVPTGKYDPQEKSSVQTANIFQLGTGSVDFTFNASYDLRIQDFGINAMASYKVNTANKERYQYGNKISGNLQAYYKVRVKNKFTVAPNAGLLYERAALDYDKGYSVFISGGSILMQTLGAEITFKKFGVGGNWQSPTSQHLAGGFVKAGNRSMVHLSFML